MKCISKPKRLPRKLKKSIIKSWNRKIYHGVMKGYIIIAPYAIEYEEPKILGYQGFNENAFERYLKKEINEEFYGKLNFDKS